MQCRKVEQLLSKLKVLVAEGKEREASLKKERDPEDVRCSEEPECD